MHHLVAAYLGYEPPADEEQHADDSTPATAQPTWLGGGRSVHASDELKNATTTDEALRAAEHLFFGEVHSYGER